MRDEHLRGLDGSVLDLVVDEADFYDAEAVRRAVAEESWRRPVFRESPGPVIPPVGP